MKSQNSRNYTEEDIDLAELAKALAHPARIKIIRLLASNSCSFSEIVKELPLAGSTVSQHMTALKDMGLIKGIYEPPKVKYFINKKIWKKFKSVMGSFLNMKIIKK